jgi:hypothetical protein
MGLGLVELGHRLEKNTDFLTRINGNGKIRIY